MRSTTSGYNSSANKFTFTGHEKDEETGLIYANARFYDPDIGRFLTQDSLLGDVTNVPTLHRYSYSFANPIRFIDPTGNLGLDALLEGAETFVETAASQTVNVVVGIGRAAIGTVSETGALIHDTAVLTADLAGFDTGVQLKSQTAKAVGARMLSGEGVHDLTKEIITDTGLNIATFGAYGVFREQLEATADFVTGRETIDGLEDRLANAAGGAVLNAGLASAFSIRAGQGPLGKPIKFGTAEIPVPGGLHPALVTEGAGTVAVPKLIKVPTVASGPPPQVTLPTALFAAQVNQTREAGSSVSRKSSTTATTVKVKRGPNEATFTVSEGGGPVKVQGRLKKDFGRTRRSSGERRLQQAVGKKGQTGDEGGHFIAHRFLGDQGIKNLFPQNTNFNRSAFKKMENFFASQIRQGRTVKFRGTLGSSSRARPSEVLIEYQVFDSKGKLVQSGDFQFSNMAGQQFKTP